MKKTIIIIIIAILSISTVFCVGPTEVEVSITNENNSTITRVTNVNDVTEKNFLGYDNSINKEETRFFKYDIRDGGSEKFYLWNNNTMVGTIIVTEYDYSFTYKADGSID